VTLDCSLASLQVSGRACYRYSFSLIPRNRVVPQLSSLQRDVANAGMASPRVRVREQQQLDHVHVAQITGRQGLPSFKIRPKALSRHGRQMIMELSHGQPGGHTFFNVAKQSRLSSMSIRHNFEASRRCLLLVLRDSMPGCARDGVSTGGCATRASSSSRAVPAATEPCRRVHKRTARFTA